MNWPILPLQIDTFDFVFLISELAEMTHPYFFGYGSLVNAATHRYAPTERLRIQGWRRTWQQAIDHPVALLSAVRAVLQIFSGFNDTCGVLATAVLAWQAQRHDEPRGVECGVGCTLVAVTVLLAAMSLFLPTSRQKGITFNFTAQ